MIFLHAAFMVLGFSVASDLILDPNSARSSDDLAAALSCLGGCFFLRWMLKTTRVKTKS